MVAATTNTELNGQEYGKYNVSHILQVMNDASLLQLTGIGIANRLSTFMEAEHTCPSFGRKIIHSIP